MDNFTQDNGKHDARRELIDAWLACLIFPWGNKLRYSGEAVHALGFWKALHVLTAMLLAYDLYLMASNVIQIASWIAYLFLLFFVAAIAIAQWPGQEYSVSAARRWINTATYFWFGLLWFSVMFKATTPFFFALAILAEHRHVDRFWESVASLLLMCCYFVLMVYSTKGFRKVGAPR